MSFALPQLPAWVPDWVAPLFTPEVGAALLAFSVVTVVATAVGVPWFFCRIEPDHFHDEQRLSMAFVPRGSFWRPVLLLLRNVLGVVLIVLGVLMLVLPGQGLLTIIVGLLLLSFRGKRRFERWLISQETVFRGINALRRRAQRPPLLRPHPPRDR